jgi:hypothetical protein
MDLFARKNQKLSAVDPGMQAGRQAGYNADDNLPKSFRTSDTTNQPTNQEMTNPELTFLTIDVTCMCLQSQRKQLHE